MTADEASELADIARVKAAALRREVDRLLELAGDLEDHAAELTNGRPEFRGEDAQEYHHNLMLEGAHLDDRCREA